MTHVFELDCPQAFVRAKYPNARLTRDYLNRIRIDLGQVTFTFLPEKTEHGAWEEMRKVIERDMIKAAGK